jgi:hypothetical protein
MDFLTICELSAKDWALEFIPPKEYTIVAKKQLSRPHDLCLRGQRVYRQLVAEAEFEPWITQPLKERLGHVSLRLLESLVLKHSKDQNIHYEWQGQEFYIHSGYQQQLKHCSKVYFDPFERGGEVIHQLSTGTFITFSLCQASFLWWCHQFGIIQYLNDHIQDVTVKKRSFRPMQLKLR